MRLQRAGAAGSLMAVVGLALLATAAPAAAQAAFDWRLGGGLEHGAIRSTGPDQAGEPTMTVFSASLERSIGDRFSVGVEWTGAWFESLYGDEQRQALVVTGAVHPWRGLHLTAGAGPGLASWRTVEGPPAEGAGDVLISFSEGDPALALVAGAGYDLPLGPFLVTPRARLIGHRLNGETVSLFVAGVKLGLRAGR